METTPVVGELESYFLAPSDVAGTITVLAKNACDGDGYRRVSSYLEERRQCGGSRRAVCGFARESGKRPQGAAGSHRVHEREAEERGGQLLLSHLTPATPSAGRGFASNLAILGANSRRE